MTHPPTLYPIFREYPQLDYYIDDFNRVYDKVKQPLRCHICNSHLEYAYNTIGLHCTDWLKHKVENSI